MIIREIIFHAWEPTKVCYIVHKTICEHAWYMSRSIITWNLLLKLMWWFQPNINRHILQTSECTVVVLIWMPNHFVDKIQHIYHNAMIIIMGKWRICNFFWNLSLELITAIYYYRYFSTMTFSKVLLYLGSTNEVRIHEWQMGIASHSLPPYNSLHPSIHCYVGTEIERLA